MKKTLFTLKLLFLLCLSLQNNTIYAEVLEWAKSMGGSKVDDSRSIAIDKDGNTYIVGTMYGTTDFNPGTGVDTLSPRGTQDAFLAKYDVSGNYLWAVAIGGDRADEGRAVAVDGDGNAYVTGFFVFRAFFDPSGKDTVKAGTGFQDAFVAKYDRNGNYKWAVNMGGTKINNGIAITVSKQKNVYVTGAFSGISNFEPGTTAGQLTASPGGMFGRGEADIFMAKYDSTGKYVWAKSMGAAQEDDYGYGIAVDEAEHVFLTGYFGNTADFDPSANNSFLISKGIHDVFIAKYDRDGNYLWARSMGGKADDNGLGLAIDKTSNVYVTGYFADTAIFDPWATAIDTLVSAGRKRPDISYSDFDMFIAKYDSAGKYIWSRTLGSNFDDIGNAVAIDRVGNILVTGTFADTAAFDPASRAGDTLISLGGKTHLDGFLAKYDPNGQYIWGGSIGGSYSYTYSTDIACDDKGNTFATGRFLDTADLDPGKQNTRFLSTGSSDIFILKLACNDTTSALLATTTCAESYTWNGEVYTASGTYRQVYSNSAGCDSTAILQLTLSKVDKPGITVNGFTLGLTSTYAHYQWLKNGTLIEGATENTYSVTENADYQVIVTNEDGCTDTSDVYKIDNYTGILSPRDIAISIAVFPNPVKDRLNITAPFPIQATLVNLQGKVLQRVPNAQILPVHDLATGLYFLMIRDDKGRLLKTEKITKSTE